VTTPAELLDHRNGPGALAAFAAGCAARLTPVFEAFARTGKGRYADWLAQLWTCIGSPDPSRSRGLEQRIMAAPEASVDDSNRPDYYAMRALGVLFYAVQVLTADDMAAAVLRCSRAAGSLLRDFDFVLGGPPGSAGSLAGLELRAEREWLDKVNTSSRGPVGSQAMDEARTSAVYMRLQDVPGEIARAQDWDLAAWAALGEEQRCRVTYADLVAVWGEGNVVRLPVDGTGDAELPADARRILTEVGLPEEVESLFAQSGPEWVAGTGGVRKYLKIGTDYGYDIGIVADSGEVLSLSSSGHYPSRFVNSRLEYFVEFLCRVVAARRRFRGLDFENEIRPQVVSLEAELRARDPRAFSNPDHWWSVIFEQMKVGLL